jgi:hypothetical protein
MRRLSPRGLLLAASLWLLFTAGIGRAAPAPFTGALPADKPITPGPKAAPSPVPDRPKLLVAGQGAADPLVVTWLDQEDGTATLDEATATRLHDLFAGAIWAILDSGDIILAHEKGDRLEPFLGAAYLRNDKNSFFQFHGRSKVLGSPGSTTYVNGAIRRSQSDPGRGVADLVVVEMQKDGKTVANSYITQAIDFSKKLAAREDDYAKLAAWAARDNRRLLVDPAPLRLWPRLHVEVSGKLRGAGLRDGTR